MKQNSDEQFISYINHLLNRLTFKLKDDYVMQTLLINSYSEINFSPNAGGSALGGSQSWIASKHKSGKIHEPGMIATIEALFHLAEIEYIFDVGALYGYFSLIFLAMSRNAQVFAFEMNPKSFTAMQQNIRCNPHLDITRILTTNCVLSDFTETSRKSLIRDFLIRDYSDIINLQQERLLSDREQKYSASKKELSLEEIDFWSIDEWCHQHQVTPDLIKIDVEGLQSKIIPGAMNTISQSLPFILLEFDSPNAVNASNVSNKEIVQPLFELGYKMAWGLHRNRETRFSMVQHADMNFRHECNSLGIFFIESKLRNFFK